MQTYISGTIGEEIRETKLRYFRPLGEEEVMVVSKMVKLA